MGINMISYAIIYTIYEDAPHRFLKRDGWDMG